MNTKIEQKLVILTGKFCRKYLDQIHKLTALGELKLIISYVINWKHPNILEHNVYYTGAVIEGQQTSIDLWYIITKNHSINEESINTVSYTE